MACRTGFAPLLEVVWLEGELADRGLDLLVDAVSIAWLHAQRLDEVFAFDRHLDREGFVRIR